MSIRWVIWRRVNSAIQVVLSVADEIMGCVQRKIDGALFVIPHGNSGEFQSGEIRIKVQHQQCACPSHLGLRSLYLLPHLLLAGGFQLLSRL